MKLRQVGYGDGRMTLDTYEIVDDWRWLESTKRLQREAYGFDADTLDTSAQAEFIKENVLPLVDEAMEVLHEVKWKYWSHDEPFVHREEVLKECVDVGHFLANILVAIGATDEEWEQAYQRKQAENRRRQVEGYRVERK